MMKEFSCGKFCDKIEKHNIERFVGLYDIYIFIDMKRVYIYSDLYTRACGYNGTVTHIQKKNYLAKCTFL